MESKKTKKESKSSKKHQKEIIEESNKNINIYLNQELPKEGEQFTDILFPPDESSLLGQNTTGKFPSEIEKEKNIIPSSEIEWRRSKNIFAEPHLFEGEISIKNICTGITTNSYFLSAVDALCKYPNLISKIFLTKKYDKEKCCFELVLFIDGGFQIIYLDDYFPCIKGTSVPYFSKPTTFELWYMLLEKAWAKVNGGYGNILVGNPSEIFRFLTGFCTERINNKLYDNKNYINFLKNCNESNDIIFFSTRNEDDVEEIGLIKDNNYILSNVVKIKDKNNEEIFLFKLRNPILSENKWKGDWNDKSDNWTDEVNKQIDKDILERNYNEFFININDLLKYFNITDICHILFNASSQIFDFSFHEEKNLEESQMFNFYIENKGKVSIYVAEKNWRFHKDLNYYPHPTSLVLVQYDPEEIIIKKIYTDFESDKDLEKTIFLNEGFYLLWIYKNFLNEEGDINKNMKVKILTESQTYIKPLGPDNDLQIIQQIIYEETKLEKDNLINNSEIFHYISNEFKNSGLAYRIAINPLSNYYQKWNIDSSETKDFTIIYPKLNPQNQSEIIIEENNYSIIIAIRNKKYGKFNFNTKIDAEQFEGTSKKEKSIKSLKDFKKYFSKDKTNLEKISTKETGLHEELSKKEEFSAVDHGKIFVEKYRKKYNIIEKVLEMEQNENNKNNKNLRWVKIKKNNGLYLGEADQNLPQGRGCFIYNESILGKTINWVGYFDKGQKGNFGRIFNEEGRLIYEGEYKDGLRNGKGTYYYNGGCKYVGEFVNGNIEGNGVFYWEDGTRWEGPFKNNLMNGEGKYYNKDESFSCTYKDGKEV